MKENQPEFPISTPFLRNHTPTTHSRQPPIALAAGCVLSAAPLAVLLTALASGIRVQILE